jgi:hypothetical protein
MRVSDMGAGSVATVDYAGMGWRLQGGDGRDAVIFL